MDFFSKNYSYINTEKFRWNIEDGYSFLTENDILLNTIPARTGGISYYHRLRLMLHMYDGRFLECPYGDAENHFMVRIIIILLYSNEIIVIHN